MEAELQWPISGPHQTKGRVWNEGESIQRPGWRDIPIPYEEEGISICRDGHRLSTGILRRQGGRS
jgi:hypothetical protein